MLRAMQCPHDGTRRLLLNILHHLPVPKPVNAAFFDFCLQGMLSSAESASGQAVCMKLAYDICPEEPELTGELKAYLENMEPEYYTVAVQCVRNNILKKNKVMKILILNGSPRCQGLISRMLDIMAEEARIRGAEVEAISIHKLQVRPCTGCMACRSRQACVLPEDDAQRTLQKIQWADVLIVGSPCYWGNMNGHLKVVFDRIVYGMMGESPKGLPQALHKGKKAVIVSTCSTPWPFNIWFNQTRGVVKALREILKWSGFSIKGVIQKGGTKQHPELTESDKKKCRKIIRNL